jgi:hypothetical protein
MYLTGEDSTTQGTWMTQHITDDRCGSRRAWWIIQESRRRVEGSSRPAPAPSGRGRRPRSEQADDGANITRRIVLSKVRGGHLGDMRAGLAGERAGQAAAI